MVFHSDEKVSVARVTSTKFSDAKTKNFPGRVRFQIDAVSSTILTDNNICSGQADKGFS